MVTRTKWMLTALVLAILSALVLAILSALVLAILSALVLAILSALGRPGGMLVASRRAKRGRLVRFRLAPGHYRVGNRAPKGAQISARSFTIRAGYTTVRYVIEPVP
jgi:hypothetical protein